MPSGCRPLSRLDYPETDAAYGGPDTLAVDNAGGWGGLLAGLLACSHDQLGVQHRPGSVLPPAPEIAEHRALGRQLLGQEIPRAAAAQEIEDGVQDLAQIDRARPTEAARGRQVRHDQGELGVGQVGCVACRRPRILAPGGSGPGHRSFLTVWQSELRATR
jgi:hypothetical protein